LFPGLFTSFVNFVFKGNRQKLSRFQISYKILSCCRIIRPYAGSSGPGKDRKIRRKAGSSGPDVFLPNFFRKFLNRPIHSPSRPSVDPFIGFKLQVCLLMTAGGGFWRHVNARVSMLQAKNSRRSTKCVLSCWMAVGNETLLFINEIFLLVVRCNPIIFK